MCKGDDDCSRYERCLNGTCTRTAADQRAIRAALVVGLGIAIALASSCAPSAAQLREAGLWVVRAELACGSPCKDSAPKACVAAVITAAVPAAGRAEYLRAKTACDPYRTPNDLD